MKHDRDDQKQLSYILSDGHQCPKCGWYELEVDETFDRDGLEARVECRCSCGYAFNAVYKLQRFEDL